MAKRLAITTALACLLAQAAIAQYPTPVYPTQPTNGTMMLDSPEVGYLQGIQRFGENLRTDPDPGIGYTYRVFPSVGAGGGSMDEESFVWAFAHLPEAMRLKSLYEDYAQALVKRDEQLATRDPSINTTDIHVKELQVQIQELQLGLKLALGGRSAQFNNRYPTARNTTAGLRTPSDLDRRAGGPASYSSLTAAIAQGAGLPAPLPAADGASTDAAATGGVPTAELTLYEQPLIQVKVRLIEADRINTSDFRSVLDYIDSNGKTSSITANNINKGNQGTRVATRLPSPARLLTEPASGLFKDLDPNQLQSGALVNLTTEHLNFITNMLVTEFNSDVFTVPEVVTLNGQNVEFVAGDKRAFPLGLTLAQGSSQTRQEFFFKHVGTVVSITPRIVNWGKYLEGSGEAPIVAQEIGNWNRLAEWMNNKNNLTIDNKDLTLSAIIEDKTPVTYETKKAMLAELERYPTKLLRERFNQFDSEMRDKPGEHITAASQPADSINPFRDSEDTDNQAALSTSTPTPILRQPTGCACDWKPEDCTIDLEIMIRESNVDSISHENENAIANIVQVKSGYGVVMGGMIASSEITSVSKVPILGDLPIAGYLFRAKSTDRARSELVILVEATVLPKAPHARDVSARDFALASGYINAELQDNPLEIGMYRAGFGEYLPPACPSECDFWVEHGNKMRRIATECDDVFK